MPGFPDAGIGDEQDAVKAKVASELSDAGYGAGAEEDPGPRLKVEGNHLK